jgi:hypothetical protein
VLAALLVSTLVVVGVTLYRVTQIENEQARAEQTTTITAARALLDFQPSARLGSSSRLQDCKLAWRTSRSA